MDTSRTPILNDLLYEAAKQIEACAVASAPERWLYSPWRRPALSRSEAVQREYRLFLSCHGDEIILVFSSVERGLRTDRGHLVRGIVCGLVCYEFKPAQHLPAGDYSITQNDDDHIEVVDERSKAAYILPAFATSH